MRQAGVLGPAREPAPASVTERRSDLALQAAGRSLVMALLFLSVTLFFLISPLTLFDLGFNYGDVGGSFIEKIHPGTWIASLALMLTAIGRGNPLRFIETIVASRGVAILLATWIVVFIYAGFIQKVPATPLVDTFLLPVILFLLIGDLGERPKRALALLVHLFMTANAALGIFEYLSGFRLISETEAMGAIQIDWRSTALLGHPLANASMAGAYALALSIGGGRDVAAPLRPLFIALQLVAMVAFGGRAALVTTLILLCVVVIARLVGILRGTRLDLRFLALVSFALPFVVAASVAAAQGGFFDQFLDRFVNDRGSASTRVVMLTLFDIFPLRDIILGPDPAALASIQYLEDINYGIESFWVGFIMSYGLAISLMFFAGLAAFCFELAGATRPATGLLLLSFFAVASTSVSLSVKTPLFGMFAVLCLTLMRRQAGAAPDLAGARR